MTIYCIKVSIWQRLRYASIDIPVKTVKKLGQVLDKYLQGSAICDPDLLDR